MNDTVTTITGKQLPKKDCRKMQGIYYQKGDVNIENSGECYYINEKYYKYNTGYILFNHSVKKYQIKSSIPKLVEKGIIGFTDSNSPIFGAFSKPSEEIYLINGGNEYLVIDESLINKKYYIESLVDGKFYQRNEIRAIDFLYPVECNQNVKRNLPYDSRGILEKHIIKYNKYYSPEYCNILSYFNKKEVDLTNDLTFGLEFETTRGFIPNRILEKLGLISLRDGSISGLEFVTIPLKENKGLQSVLDILNELSNRTTFDNNCSLHLHVGNLPRTETFFIAMFKILFVLQDSIFEMFPFHKKHNHGIKRKAYTKPLPLETILKLDNKIKTKKDIVKNFNHIFKFLSLYKDYNEFDNKLENVKCHPSDPGGNAKWNIKSRYYWVNLIPLLFGNKETIEFRIHTPTYNNNKVLYYMFLCFSIIDYVKEHESKILKDFNNFVNISINDILINSYHKKSKGHHLFSDLQRYFDSRKRHFYNKTGSGDFIANENEFEKNFLLDFSDKNPVKEVEKVEEKIKVNTFQELEFRNEEIQFNPNHRPVQGRPAAIGIEEQERIVREVLENNNLNIGENNGGN